MKSSKKNKENFEEIADRICKRYAQRFAFGIYDTDDIYQEAYIMIMEAMDRYDGVSPLENFLVTHVKNRLISLKRDNYARPSNACNFCSKFDPECEKCQQRQRTYEIKKNLNEPLDINMVKSDNESRMIDDCDPSVEVENDEIVRLINKHLPVQYRENYLKIRDGVYVSKQIRKEIEEVVLRIINEYV